MSLFWWKKPEVRRPPAGVSGDDWITIPFSFAEAARVSLHIIGSQPEIPPALRLWIRTWLDAYNAQLVEYMRENYGNDIFPTLDRITVDVMTKDSGRQHVSKDSWEKWERELREDR